LIQLTQIGTVKSEFTEPADPFAMRKRESTIVVQEEYREGLYRLEESSYVQVVFGFHLADPRPLKGPVYSGETKGVFASRSPHRPTPLGVTTVKLNHSEDGILVVGGLDAIDGSPVYDIKPYAPVFDTVEPPPREAGEAYADPRIAIIRALKNNDLSACLLASGVLHGHFCPGLSLGVYASVTAMKRLREIHTDGMEDLVAVVETNNCFADGVQAVTGCTFGNNALVYHDLGKTAVTLLRGGKPEGVRVSVKPGFHDLLGTRYPEFSRLFDTVVKNRAGGADELSAFKVEGRKAAFGLLDLPADELFTSLVTAAAPPPRAPIVPSVTCTGCGEQVMETKTVPRDHGVLCRTCAGAPFPRVAGGGISP
jgi:tRNA-Thr(GGU) m(6)t(6)A37 methyltransferase TsaA